jgi:hypothetical protein
MLNWFFRRRADKQSICSEADILIAAHGGEGALHIAYSRSRDMAGDDSARARSMKVRREIERRTGVKRGPDTATRYLIGT